MSCSICLESYLDVSKVPDAEERFPYLLLDKENLPPTSQGCCFFRTKGPKKHNEDFHSESHSQAVATRCGHIFHYSCISNWTWTDSDDPSSNGKRGCPVCRQTIVLKNLIKLHLDSHVIIRQETPAGLLVSMSLNQFNRLKEGFALGYRSGEEKFEEEFQARINNEKVWKEQAQKEILKLKAEHEAELETLKAENEVAIEKVKSELLAKRKN